MTEVNLNCLKETIRAQANYDYKTQTVLIKRAIIIENL